METVNLKVMGMTCGSCVKHVEKAINSIAGVESVVVDLASGAVEITGEISQKVGEIIAALEEDGYSAQVFSGEVGKSKNGSCKSGSSCCCG
jgi:copper chaperone CopZ